MADLAAGHDDQILAEAEQLGVVRPVSEAYYNGSSRFILRWDNLWKPDRLELVAGTGSVFYGSKIQGGDTNLEVSGAYRRHFSSSLVVDVAGTVFQFRRGEKTSEEPVFDFDLHRVNSRIGWSVDPDWLWSAGVQHDWIQFPGRFLVADTTDREEQRQFNLSLALMRRVGQRGFVTGELLYRWTTSNSAPAEYEGPVFTLKTRNDLLGLRVSSYVSFGHRSYRSLSDTLAHRKDDTWQFGTKLTRSLSPRVALFLEGSVLHQISSRDPFAYDQSRVALGVSVHLLAPGPWSPSGLKPQSTPYSPVPTRRGIRFRIRDPEAASVTLVGGFNAWDPLAHSLSGPDKNGVWEMVLPLTPGIWRYAFVVDGRFVVPPEAPRYEDDGFGGRHGVLEVSGGQGDGSVTAASGSRRRE